jgi:hypothetical protein
MDIELGWVVGQQRVEQQCKGANAAEPRAKVKLVLGLTVFGRPRS